MRSLTLFALLTLLALALTKAFATTAKQPSPGIVRAIKCLHKQSNKYLAVIHDGQHGPYAHFKAFRHKRSRRVDRFVRCANKPALYADIQQFYQNALGYCSHASCNVVEDGSCTCTDDFPDCVDTAFQKTVLNCNRPSPTPSPSSTPQPGVVRLIKCADSITGKFFAVVHDGQNGRFARFKAIQADETEVDRFVTCGNSSGNYPALESYFSTALSHCFHASCDITGYACTCSDSYSLCEDSQLNQAAATCT